MMMKKKTIGMAALVTLLLGMWLAPCWAASGKINWLKYDEGLALAKKENKKIFLSFHADWCGYCVKMEKETFTDAAVSTYLNQNFTPIMVDSDKEKKIAGAYNVRALPTNWFLEADSSKISTLPGYVDAKQLLSILKFIKTESYKKMSFKEFINK
jgi:thioredoxin-related protein